MARWHSSTLTPSACKIERFLSTSWRAGSRRARAWYKNQPRLSRKPIRVGIPAKNNSNALRRDLWGVIARVNFLALRTAALRHTPTMPRSAFLLSSTMISSMAGWSCKSSRLRGKQSTLNFFIGNRRLSSSMRGNVKTVSPRKLVCSTRTFYQLNADMGSINVWPRRSA